MQKMKHYSRKEIREMMCDDLQRSLMWQFVTKYFRAKKIKKRKLKKFINNISCEHQYTD